jgi:predicted DNA-binding transcriptional regulator AlpA
MNGRRPRPEETGGAVDGSQQHHSTAPPSSPDISIRDKLTWSLAEFSAVSNLSPRFIQRGVAAGTIPPPIKIGRRSLFRSATVVAWLDSLAQQQADGRRMRP